MYKYLLLFSITVSGILQAIRDPFSFSSKSWNHYELTDTIKENEIKNPENSMDKSDKKFIVGDKLDDNWTIKSVTDNTLILQNDKGQVCEVSLDISKKQKKN